jgi:hypothetical protein
MSTLKLENIKHENSSTNNMVMDSDGSVSTTGNASVAGTLDVTGDTTVVTNTQVQLRIENTAANNLGSYMKIRDGNSTAGQHTWIGRSTHDTYIYSNNSDLGMKITNAGQVTKPNQPVFQAHDLASGTSNIDLIYTTTRTNIGGHYSTSTGRFTAPVAGTYLFGFGNIANSGNGTYRYYIRKNGANITQLRVDTNETGSAYGTNATFTMPLTCAVNDYVNIYYIESNQAYTQEVGSGYPLFWGYLIG